MNTKIKWHKLTKEQALSEELGKLSIELISRKEKKFLRDKKAVSNNKAYIWLNIWPNSSLNRKTYFKSNSNFQSNIAMIPLSLTPQNPLFPQILIQDPRDTTDILEKDRMNTIPNHTFQHKRRQDPISRTSMRHNPLITVPTTPKIAVPMLLF